MDSILNSIKKLLGIEPEYTHFDSDIILTINSVLLSVNQIGIGPSEGFNVTGETETWADLLGNRTDINAVRTYIQLKTRLIFDPPSTAHVLEAMERQVKEIEWRLNVQVDKGGVV